MDTLFVESDRKALPDNAAKLTGTFTALTLPSAGSGSFGPFGSATERPIESSELLFESSPIAPLPVPKAPTGGMSTKQIVFWSVLVVMGLAAGALAAVLTSL